MMKQQLDFIKNIPKPLHHLSTSMMGLIILGCLGFFLLVSISVQIYKNVENNQLNQLIVEKQIEADKFQKLAKQYPLLASNTPLVTKVAQFEKIFNEKHVEFEKLSHATLRMPFSLYLKAIATAIPSGIWLKNIWINEETDSYSLSGFAIDASAITIFVQKLQTVYPFNKVTFVLFSFKKNEKTNLIEFEIADDKLLNKDLNATPIS